MIRNLANAFLVFIALGPVAWTQSPYTTEVFRRDEPRAFFFRRENLAIQTGEADWLTAVEPFAGVVNKGVHEELCQPWLDENRDRCRSLRAADESQLFLLHFNSNARETVCNGTSQIDPYFAGHWLYLPGCDLGGNIDASQDVIPVADSSRFKMDVGLSPGFNDDIVIVPKVGGVFLWEQAEHVVLLEVLSGGPGGPIIGGGGSLRVLRGQYGSTARAFNAGETWIAPHAHEGPWGSAAYNRLLWEYNLGPNSPRDSQGRSCADVLRAELVAILEDDPDTNFYDGVEFDISRFDKRGWYKGRHIDLNLDGQGDREATALQRDYGRGVLQFYSDLRADLGPDRLMLADGGMEDSQRSFGVLNGMESEGFPDLWDIDEDGIQLERWSNLINRLDYWRRHAFQPSLNYVVVKDFLHQGATTAPPDSLVRLALATAVCTESVFAYTSNPGQVGGIAVWDEIDKASGEFGWLGQPLGATRRLGLEAPDQLFGLGAPEIGFDARWRSSQASISQVDGEFLKIQPHAGLDSARATVTTYVRLGGNTEVLVSAELWADPLNEFQGWQVTRTIKMRHLAGGTSFALGSSTGLGVQIDGPDAGVLALPEGGVSALAGTDASKVSFLLRDIPKQTYALELELEIEGDEPVYLANFQVHAGADWMVRSFENGVVLANPSDHPKDFSLEALFPGRVLRFLDHRSAQDSEPTGFAPAKLTLAAHSGTFLQDVGPPRAGFTSSLAYGPAPLSVDFTNESLGEVSQFAWDFGDGATSSLANPSHTFTDGVHTVSLTVQGPGGSDTAVRTAWVVVDANLLTTTHTHAQEFGGGEWTYEARTAGGGEPMSLHPSGEYFHGAGTWSRIYDDFLIADGATSALGWTLSTALGQAPVSVSVSGPAVRKRNTQGGDGTLFSLEENGEVVSGPRHVRWDDGIGESVSHDTRLVAGDSLHWLLDERNHPSNDGTYVEPTLTLRRTQAGSPPVAYFSATPRVGSGPLDVQFTDRSFFGASQWAWDFDGDGQTDSLQRNPSFVYTTPGRYDVRLRIDGGASELVLEDWIHVRESWRATTNFPTSAPGSNSYGAWSAWEWRQGFGYSPMSSWNATERCFQGTATWSRVYQNFQTAQGAHSVRAWRAPATGLYRIEGIVENGQTTCGDGIKVEIRDQVRRVWGPLIMEANETTALAFDLVLALDQDALLYFHVDPRQGIGCDDAVWIPTVTRLD